MRKRHGSGRRGSRVGSLLPEPLRFSSSTKKGPFHVQSISAGRPRCRLRRSRDCGRCCEGEARVTTIFDHPLPSVPGKSLRGVLVEYGPGGSSPSHTHAASAFISATVIVGEVRSRINDGPEKVFRVGESFVEMPVITTVSALMQRHRALQAPRRLRRGHG